jgi:hypothetical protein
MQFSNLTQFDTRVSNDVLSGDWIVVETTTLVPWTLDGRPLGEVVRLRDEFLPDRPVHHLEPDRRHILDVTLCGRLSLARAFESARLALAVDDHSFEAQLWGPRVWSSSGGKLRPSTPRPTHEVDLGWGNALGGRVKRDPGLIRNTMLPSPSFEESWPENPSGIGFYGAPDEAEGRPVPGIEHVDAPNSSYDSLGRSWSFAGVPPGTSHALTHIECRSDGQLRSRFPDDPNPRTRLSCKAPPWLRFDAIVGVRRVVCSVGAQAVLDLPVPSVPFSCEIRTGTRRLVRQSRLLWIEIDLDAKRACGLYFARLFCPYIRGEMRSVRLLPSVSGSLAAS